MFKIESYITPILLNYVAKYVKNIRPEDAQLSLWEGEANFHNLDLNLEVLQDELNLPVEFLSGHIHDLSIYVPWTKITSEPIRITINTIEFVLKLKNTEETSNGSSATSSPQRQDSIVKRTSKRDSALQAQQQQQQYTGAGLVNKIINNITFDCQNIILKYVEEDMVLSMNVQMFSFRAANENWQPAMTDVHHSNVLMRKLITISDLTICLDKRNAAGRIDVSQEPILYRCTFELRILHKYKKSTSKISSTFRVGIFTKLMDMNVSSLQFPMLIRLFELVQILQKRVTNTQVLPEEVQNEESEEPIIDEAAAGSYLSWAWNMLPSFAAEIIEDEEQDEDASQIGHTVELSFYMEEFNFTLKQSEFVPDNMMAGSRRIRYSPIVRVHLCGIYVEFLNLNEKLWTNIKGGISNITIEPLGAYRGDEKWSVTLVNSPALQNIDSFKDKSLFDDNLSKNDKMLWNVTNYKSYCEHFTDEYLCFRTPVFAFDRVEYNSDPRSSAQNSDVDVVIQPTEADAINKSVQMRFMSSGLKICYNKAFQQVWNVINDYIRPYDYSAYHSASIKTTESTISVTKMHPPLMEDYDALMNHIPRCVYFVKLRNFTLECHAKLEADAPIIMGVQPPQKVLKKFPTYFKPQFPYFCLRLKEISLELTTALKADKLVHTTCQLPDKPEELLNACYDSYSIDLLDLEIYLQQITDELKAQLIQLPELHINYGSLLKPHLWQTDEIAVQKCSISCNQLFLMFSKRQLLLTQIMLNCIKTYEPHLLQKALRLISAQDNQDADLIKMQIEFSNFDMKHQGFHSYMLIKCDLQELKMSVAYEHELHTYQRIVLDTNQKNSKNWLECQIQMPDKVKDPDGIIVILMWINNYQFQVDNNMLKFLKYQEPKTNDEIDLTTEIEVTQTVLTSGPPNYSALSTSIYTSQQSSNQRRRISRSSSMHTRKLSHPEETVHFSSERDERQELENNSMQEVLCEKPDCTNNKTNWCEVLHKLVLQIEMLEGNLCIAPTNKGNKNQQNSSDFTKLVFPKILVKSPNIEYQKGTEIINKIDFQLTDKEVSWVIKMVDFSVQNCENFEDYELLAKAQTTITVAFALNSALRETKDSMLNNAKEKKKSHKRSSNKSSHLQVDVVAVAPSQTDKSFGSDNADSGSLRGHTTSDSHISSNSSKHSLDARKSDQQQAKIITKSPMCINLHADTPPIHILIKSKKVPIIYEHVNFLLKLLQLTKSSSDSMRISSESEKQPIKIVSPTEANASLKEFMEMESNSENSLRPVEENIGNNDSLFCQWTITKVSITLEDFCQNNIVRCKLALEIEDLLATIDQHDAYTKCTGKVGHFNMGYSEYIESQEEWIPCGKLDVKVLTETSGNPFLHVILTSVALRDYYSRVGIKRHGDPNQNITEIIVDMMALELTIDLNKLEKIMKPLVSVINNDKSCASTIETSKSVSVPMTAQNMPMVHLNSRGFTLYMPLISANAECSALILKIHSIQITPNLENPLQRSPVRTDVFYKAAQMGLLGLPGALVEDRQYELTLQNISAATGNWQEISAHLVKRNTSFNYHTNPAFEWNHQNQDTHLQLNDIFSNFTVSIILAPYITYNNVLICGQAMELNCTTDFVASINMHQLNLMICIINRFQKILNYSGPTHHSSTKKDRKLLRKIKSEILSKNNSRINFKISETENITQTQVVNIDKGASSHKALDILPSMLSIRSSGDTLKNTSSFKNINSFDTIKENSDLKAKSDSGFQSLQSNKPQLQITNKTEMQLPNTISFVAGMFLIKMFDVQTVTNTTKSIPTLDILPMFSICISQPSFMFTQNIKDQIIQMSLFNFNINVAGREHNNMRRPTKINEEDANLFPDILFETKSGQLTASGIPPPLMSLKIQTNAMQLREVDMDIAKPITISLNEPRIFNFLENLLQIYSIIAQHSSFLSPRQNVVVVRASKLKLLRMQFFTADRLLVKCKDLTFSYTDRVNSSCKFVVGDSRAHMKFLSRPEKAVFQVNFGSFHLQTDQKIFLHPVTLRLSADLLNEPWHKLPIVNFIANLNVVQMDVSIYSILRLKSMLDELEQLESVMTDKLQVFQKSLYSANTGERLVDRNLQPFKCPSNISQYSNKSCKQPEEYYQDDLRAGAFQFVELTTETVLPLPYQIQIIKKNFGIICWRYPQPRKMSKILIYPVLMNSTIPIQIKCVMEYFSEVHESFLPYCQFSLSETNTKEIELPERGICANIWRVVILQALVTVNGECFDTSEEDEDLHTVGKSKVDMMNENDFVLHPKILVGCMRVDTTFQAACVPKCQVLFRCNTLQVKMLNQPEAGDLPVPLERFRLAQTTTISQEFLVIQVNHIDLHANFYSADKYEIDCKLAMVMHCLDQSYLIMLPLLEETNFNLWLHMNRPQRQAFINLILDKLHIHMGAVIVQTLLSSKMHWEQQLSNDSLQKRKIMLPKCIVANDTHTQLVFGQTCTSQRIILEPKQCHLYAFFSTTQKQELTFYVLNNETNSVEISQSVHISLKMSCKIELKPIIIGRVCLLIQLSRLSATQMYVLVKGQIEVISMINHDMRLEFRVEDLQNENKAKPSIEYMIDKYGRGTFINTVKRKTNIFMRLKMGTKGKGRTGDIPLKTNKTLPWLVKVPTQTNDFVSFWVRVLREDITQLKTTKFLPQRILITIWPIFEIKSYLTKAITLKEIFTNETYALEEAGKRTQLNVPATHLTEHDLTLDYSFPVDITTLKKCMVSLKSLNWNRFFWYDENKWTIEHALQELAQSPANNWPYLDEEELRVQRISKETLPMHKVHIDHMLMTSREFSCALALNLYAWGLFINASGINVSICNISTNESMYMASNSIEMLAHIEDGFTITILNGNTKGISLPIYFAHRLPFNCTQYLVLSEKVGIDVVILVEKVVYKFLLKLNVENQQYILKFSSRFIVANFSKHNLLVLPYAMDHKEYGKKSQVLNVNEKAESIFIPMVDSLKNSIGIAIDGFNDLKEKKERCPDTAFVFFVSVKVDIADSDVSMPISLALPFTRRSFSIQNNRESIPFAATLIEREGISYLSIYENLTPTVILHNNTGIPLVVGQTDAPEHSKVTTSFPEYQGCHFDWYQTLLPLSKCYYTPSVMFANFPEIEYTKCKLVFSLYTDYPNKKVLKWSKPLLIFKSFEKFLHIPGYGDIKVIICINHRIVRVSIGYIAQQLEFSVKDLRSRLLMPNSILSIGEFDVDKNETENESLHSLDSTDTRNTYALIEKCEHFSQECETKLQWHAHCYIQKTVLSLFTEGSVKDYFKTETLAFYVDDLMLKYADDDDNHHMYLNLMNIQIDNQLFDTGFYDFPVVLCSQQLYTHQSRLPQVQTLDKFFKSILMNSPPLASFVLKMYDDEFSVQSLHCNLNPIRTYIEDGYLNALFDNLVECVPSNCVYQIEDNAERAELQRGHSLLPRDITAQVLCISQPLQLRKLHITPLNVMLSVHTSVRLYIALDHSPLSFGSYEKQHMLTVPLRLGQSLGMHYLSGAIFGAGWVVGSLEILGSPSGLARSVTTGLKDFVSMPVQGLLTGPWDFIVGFTHGSASLVRNVTAGTVNSVTKLASSVARNLDRLTLDQEHIDRTEALRRCRPQGFAEGFSQGITGLGISILGAVGGLAHHTLEASSPVQVVAGMGKGLMGALTKPISGAAELVALAGQGMLHAVGFNIMPAQRAHTINLNSMPSAYRIWSMLPDVLTTDQILFHNAVNLLVKGEIKNGYVFITSAVFALMEAKSEKLCFVVPINKVEISSDRDNNTLFYVHLIKEQPDIEEDISYTNQRIMNFLHTSKSNNKLMTTDSLQDLLQISTSDNNDRRMDCAFYISADMGQHIIEYLKIVNKKS